MMMNNETNEVTIDALRVPRDALIGREGIGFRYILDGWNAERILIAAECVGDGRWFIGGRRGTQTREVFGRPIGANQGDQFPLSLAWAQVEAADLMARRAALDSTPVSRAVRRRTPPSCWRPRRAGRPPTPPRYPRRARVQRRS